MLDILNAVIEDEGIDGVIFINLYASANLSLASAKKPVISVITAPPGVWEEGTKGLDRKKGIAILPTPERAAKAMSNLWKANLLSARGD
jgi:acyl-CoA synthetase (NDP forming)